MALEPSRILVKDDSGKVAGTITVRYSYMPPTFPRLDKSKIATSKNSNGRFAIMDENNGLIVMREGRQIDVIKGKRPWLTVNNDDRYWGVELNFPASLDEEFSITTSKQRVELSERIWTLLRDHGVLRAITNLRKRYDEEKGVVDAQIEEEKRTSERTMEEARELWEDRIEDSVEKQKRAEEALEREIQRRAKESGFPAEQVRNVVEEETRRSPYKVVIESLADAPFFRAEQMGGQVVLYINSSHAFFRSIYSAPESTPRLRAAVEILLFVIGESELDANGQRSTYYRDQRIEWSRRLDAALATLDDRLGSAQSAKRAISDRVENAADEEFIQDALVKD